MNTFLLIPAFLSFGEITVILLIAIILFGPKKIPELARGLGHGIRAMKEATEDIKREIMKPVEDIDPTKEIRETIEDSKKQIESSVEDVSNTIDDGIGPIKRS